ncbi:MAG: LicD family protein, partial [Dysgonamonadaceae bacterium]|nr:LicD family protein [Dysgonamonadaceae bacterium]
GRSFFKNAVLFISHFFTNIFSTQFLVKKIIKNSLKYRGIKSNFVGTVVWGDGYKEIMPRSIFNSYVLLPFESGNYFAVEGYDIYLKRKFGNYMQPPPENKRQSTHKFVAWWKE